MRTRTLALILSPFLTAIVSLAGVAQAAVAVGDKPTISFTDTVGGGPVNAETLKGKIVVVDFWATWCGPCMAEGPHMVELHKKYGPQGLQMLGISLDRDVDAMKKVVAEKGFAWPQLCEPGGASGRMAGEWGVRGIPSTFILSPAGAVLWSGHPAGIDGPLEKAFKEHPPVLVDPKLLAAGKEALDGAEAALKAGDAKGAARNLASVPAEAGKDAAFAARAEAARKQTESAADALVAAVDPVVAQGKFLDALATLNELSESLASLPAGAKAKAKLAELNARPEVKAKLAEAERAKAADGLLAEANGLKSSKKDDQAYPKFQRIARDYAATPAGKQAASTVAAYEKDAAFMKRYNDAAVAQKANSALGVARSYKTAGRTDLAKKKYQSIMTDFAGTSFAETAKKEMAGLGG